MNKIIQIFFLLFLVSCQKSPEQSPVKKNRESPLLAKPIKKKIGDYMSDKKDYFWAANQSDSSKYWIRLVFQEDFAIYQFHGQCLYWFFTYHTGADNIELLWSYKSDCLLDMVFLDKANGITKFPKAGDVFCEYQLVNDSVIHVQYHFPEWTDKINRMNNDSIFPTYFYLQKDSE